MVLVFTLAPVSFIKSQVGPFACPEGTIPLGPWGCYIVQKQGNRLILTYSQRYNPLQASCEVANQLGRFYVVCSGDEDEWEECARQLAGIAGNIRALREAAQEILRIEEFVSGVQEAYDLATSGVLEVAEKVVSMSIAKIILEAISSPSSPANDWIIHGYGFVVPGLAQQLGVSPSRIRIRWDQSRVYIGECYLAQVHSAIMQGISDMGEFMVRSASSILTSGAICGIVGGAIGAVVGAKVGGVGAIPGAIIGAQKGAKMCVSAGIKVAISSAPAEGIRSAIKGAARGMDVVPARLVVEIY